MLQRKEKWNEKHNGMPRLSFENEVENNLFFVQSSISNPSNWPDNEKGKKIKSKGLLLARVIQPDSQIEIDRRSEEHNKWVE